MSQFKNGKQYKVGGNCEINGYPGMYMGISPELDSAALKKDEFKPTIVGPFPTPMATFHFLSNLGLC